MPGDTRLAGRIYRHANENRSARVARYLARRIDRDTFAEDQQLSIWSNELIKSTAFEAFHLSDLGYGVRCHHDGLRAVMPVLNRADAPAEGDLARINKALLSARADLG